MIKAMFFRGSSLLLLALVIYACNSSTREESERYLTKSISAIKTREEYYKIYNAAKDSIATWALNEIGYYKYFGVSKNYLLDSLLCFNSDGTRLITSILSYHTDSNAKADGIDFFYGELINGKWYFSSGAYLTLPRELYNDNVKAALTFSELNEIALKEVYAGYLDAFGNINEDWFTQHFENVGRCAACKTREDFQKNTVLGVAAQWSTRDTAQPIKRLDDKSKVLP